MKEILRKICLTSLCLYSLFFVIGSTLAPIFAYLKYYDLSGQLTAIYMFSCHQQPDRSFWLFGYPIALCCRCYGVYISTTISCILALFNNLNIKKKTIFIMLFITIIDLFINCGLGKRLNTGNITRFVVGMMMGVIIVKVIDYILKRKGKRSMKIKKVFASFLAVTMMAFFGCPIPSAKATTDELSLYDFLKSTDSKQVTASYKYPGMKLSSNATGKTTLPANTPIIVRCTKTILTRDVVSGGTVNFAVVSDVKATNGNILIKAGTPAIAEITFAKSRDILGKSGELVINDFHTTAIDGTYIPLSGSLSSKPDEKLVLSVALGVLLCPLFLLMKGEDAQVTSGTTKTIYSVSEVYIKAIQVE